MKMEELIKYAKETATEDVVTDAKVLCHNIETLAHRMSDLLEDAPVAGALGLGLYVCLAMKDGVVFSAELGYPKGIEEAKRNADRNN